MSNTPLIIRRKGVTEVVQRETLGQCVTAGYGKPYEHRTSYQKKEVPSFSINDRILNECRKNQLTLNVKLHGGEYYSGTVNSFDKDTLYIQALPENKAVLLYRQAIVNMEALPKET